MTTHKVECAVCGATFPETAMYWHHAGQFHGLSSGFEVEFKPRQLSCYFNSGGWCLTHKYGRRANHCSEYECKA